MKEGDIAPLPLPSAVMGNPSLPHSASAPAAIPTVNTLNTPQPSLTHTLRSLSTDAEWPGTEYINTSPISFSRDGNDKLGAPQNSPRRVTPTSSNASSPRRASGALPSTGAHSRRDSTSGLSLLARPRLDSSFRRPSFATPSVHSSKSESPSDGTKSHSSLRHIGEGALDDSDSSDSDIEEPNATGESSKNQSDDERSVSQRTPRSPYLYPRNGTSTKSPLSHVAEQAWTEDEREEDGYSPSPASSDSESSNDSSPGGSPRPVRRASGRSSKSRSRSSTVASLLVSSHDPPTRQSSQSSIRTVTLDKGTVSENMSVYHDHLRSDSGATNQTFGHHRTQSGAPSGEMMFEVERRPDQRAESMKGDGARMRREQHFRDSEKRYCDIGWEALREAVESFADEVSRTTFASDSTRPTGSFREISKHVPYCL